MIKEFGYFNLKKSLRKKKGTKRDTKSIQAENKFSGLHEGEESSYLLIPFVFPFCKTVLKRGSFAFIS